MLETVLTICGAIGGLLTAYFTMKNKVNAERYAHEATILRLNNEKEVALANAKSESDNEAFIQLKQVVEERKSHTDVIMRRLEALELEHRTCENNISQLRQQNSALEAKVTILESKLGQA